MNPQDHARGWRLALTVAHGAGQRHMATVDGRRLLLLARPGDGWWALDARCRDCAVALDADPGAEDAHPVMVCAACGAVHDPARADSATVPVMVVDDEVYVLLEP